MNLEILTSETLSPVRHGFFTRRGGASSGIFEGLNCALSSSDQMDAVAMNRARVARAMGVDVGRLCTVRQVHGDKVLTVGDEVPESSCEADGLVTDRPGILLGVLTADCQPVLLADPDAGVIGAAHAGWRGAMAGILEATIDAMITLGADRGRIRASIGPTIGPGSYEVGPDFLDELLADDPENSRFFSGGQGDRLHFDLPAYGLHRLRCHGIENAEWIRHCTYTDPQRFYSYRRSVHRREADYGRMISAICL